MFGFGDFVFLTKINTMKFKLALIVLLSYTIGQSQNLDELKLETKKVYEANYLMDFNTILDYSYPKVFDLLPREEMYKTLETSFQNQEFSVRFVYPNPKFTFSEIQKINNQSFCLVRYNGAIRMKFEKALTDQIANGMLKTFQQHMKDKKVLFEKERNSFFIEGESILIAIADERTQNKWRFVNYDAGQIAFVDSIISESIRKQLGL